MPKAVALAVAVLIVTGLACAAIDRPTSRDKPNTYALQVERLTSQMQETMETACSQLAEMEEERNAYRERLHYEYPDYPDPVPSAQLTWALQPCPPIAARFGELTGIISGAITCDCQGALAKLPSDVTIVLAQMNWLSSQSEEHEIARGEVVGESSLIPAPFIIRYDPTLIDPTNSYGIFVRAVVSWHDGVHPRGYRYYNYDPPGRGQPTRVLTHGQPTDNVEVRLSVTGFIS